MTVLPEQLDSDQLLPKQHPDHYEDTFTLLHCGVGFTGTCDPNTLVDHSLFPVVPGTVLNLHFCAQPTNNGGAGNKNYARPKPSPLASTTGQRPVGQRLHKVDERPRQLEPERREPRHPSRHQHDVRQ